MDGSIWPKDQTLTDTTLRVIADLRVMAMKGYSTFSKAQALESHH